MSAIATGVAESITGYRSSSNAALPVAVLAADVIGLWAGLAGAAVFASRTLGTGSLARDFGLRIGAWWDVPFGAAVGLICQYGLIPLLYLPFEQVDKSITRQLGQPTQKDTAAAAHGSVAAAVLLILILAVGAPVVEELFFRGLLLRSLAARMPVPIAIVIDSIVFALAHYERVQFAGLAAFGVVLALLAWRTDRLAPSISAHMAFNAAAVASSLHLH